MKQVWNKGMEQGYDIRAWNKGMKQGYETNNIFYRHGTHVFHTPPPIFVRSHMDDGKGGQAGKRATGTGRRAPGA